MPEFILIYVTFPEASSAQQIAHQLVLEKKVACANIFPSVTSIYEWQGKIESSQEVVVLFKTRAMYFEDVQKMILKMHPYDCPCIVSWPMEKGNVDFLEWISQKVI